jgi:hypothetical protein
MNFFKKIGDKLGEAFKTKEEEGNSYLNCVMNGPVSQAGRPMQGIAKFKISKANKEMFANFKQGVIITATLFGYEEVYWAKGYSHDQSRGTAVKHMVNGDCRRE